jgi:hypothetical protein
MALSLFLQPPNLSINTRNSSDKSSLPLDQKFENLKTTNEDKASIISLALSDEQFRERLFSGDILKTLNLSNTDESKLIIKEIQTDVDHNLALKLAAEEFGVSPESSTSDTVIIQAQQSKLEIYNAKKTMAQIESDRKLALELQNELHDSFEPASVLISYSENPLKDLSRTWKLKVTSPRVQRLNISGNGLYCGYYSLAMNIAQFSKSQREAIYDNLGVSFEEKNLLEAERLKSINSDRPDSFYQQKLGQKLIAKYSPSFGSNINYDHLSRMAQHLGITAVIVRKNDQFFSNLSSRSDKVVDTKSFSQDQIESLRRVGILEYNNGQHYLNLTDSVQNLRDALNGDFESRQELNKDDADGIFDTLIQYYAPSNQPIAVIYNKYGSEFGGHYEAPKDLAQLLF